MVRQRLSAEARKAQVAEVALRLVARDGAGGLTAAGLARAVGVSDAALFRHFPSMERIVEAAIDRFEALLAGSLASDAATPVGRLRAFFVHRLSLVRAQPEVLQLAFNDRLADAAGVRGARRVRALVARSRAHVLDCLAAARASGEVRSDVPVEMLAWAVFGFMRGASQATPRAAAPSPDEVWDALARLLGVTPRPSVARRPAARKAAPRKPRRKS